MWRGGRKQPGIFPREPSATTTQQPQTPLGEPMPKPSEAPPTGFTGDQPLEGEQLVEVPTVRVSLVQSLRLLPHQGVLVRVKLDTLSQLSESDPVLLAPSTSESPWQVEDSIISVNCDGVAQLTVTNPTGCSCVVEAGTMLGEASSVTVVQPNQPLPEMVRAQNNPRGTQSVINRVTKSNPAQRKQALKELVGTPELLTPEQTQELQSFLGEHHEAFCLETTDRGETDIVAMEIDTSDARPKKQQPRRMPFAVRTEVAKQLRTMQDAGVIQPSSSPWASPVVMVRKRDGTHRFCVDYRELHSVTKPDTFPLPRIDDLLDQLGAACYFSTLDLASGYWQVRMHPNSVEKTAFVTPQGLFEFRVMPFGLTNAPGVFQRLMERVLAGLNPEDGPDYVVVYIDECTCVFANPRGPLRASASGHLAHPGCRT